MSLKLFSVKTKTLLLLYILSNQSFAQNTQCAFTEVLQIEAQSGMRIREKPDATAKAIGGVPYKFKIEACAETFGKATFEGIEGNWRLVRYKNTIGYMWDGLSVLVSSYKPQVTQQKFTVESQPQTAQDDYRITEASASSTAVSQAPTIVSSQQTSTKPNTSPFTEVKLITESYPYCRDITAIDRTLYYYAVMVEDEYYVIKPIDLTIELRKNSPKNKLHFDIKPSEGDGSLFIIGLPTPFKNWKKIRNNDYVLTQYNRKLTPGVRLELYASEPGNSLGNIKIMAAGTVKSYNHDCPVVENYKLLVELMLNEKEVFDVSKQISHPGACGVPDLFWFGDLNQDGYTDFILVGEYPKYTAFTLFFSQPDNPQRFKKVSEWVVEDCD
ncbi:hypothetical protein JCM31826_16200 [Thermaurantimonas aggregans]|uniref:SH3b domain-containing protein n=1 Tax=Thermaurantimonas aggregans TaxID=2173829 RepID=A0A401XMC2_9FLAO|nr:hypothetical protein [Thermaurantimonas aggregans]GCD78138.1 hypothetical protein JCM31826_16200 [Thermaurantimonas aggregans]